jgi:hypothetical protein
VRADAASEDCEAARCTIQAAIDAECPCAEAKNHGRYTSCVARVVNRAAREGTIPRSCRNKINGCAIRSTCGKKSGTVACDFPGDGVSGRCRPLASEAVCTRRGGTVVASCCDTCGAPEPTATPEEPVATATPEEPVATATEEPVATATPEEPVETATPEGPVATPTATETGPEATATEGPIATATEAPVETATPEGPFETPTPTEAVATATAEPGATPTETPAATATEAPVATATEGPIATATEGPVETATPAPEPTSTPAGPTCGNGTIDTGEDCDPPGTASCPNAGNGLEICSMGCTCECPSRVSFTGDASDPISILDTGWTGIAHRAPIITNGDVTVAADCADGRPCGVCPISGPIPNPLPGQLQNQRCSNNSFIRCTDDGECPGGTCEFYFGSNLPLAAGGVSTCVVNQFNGPVTGTVDIEAGSSVTTALLTSRVYNGITVDSPCPQCLGDPTPNDGDVEAPDTGTCDAGPRAGLPCDTNGSVPGRPDFGTTSLDCPPNPAAIIATLPIDLSSATATVTKALTVDSPNCSNSPGDKCLCDTCNNAAAEPCDSNADCPDPAGPIGPFCGGRRCLSGTNAGAACNAASECPSSSCGRPGEATKPSGCLDDTTIPDRDFECSDPDGNNEGQCTIGPVDNTCSVASGHAQRGCLNDADCGGGAGSCESVPRGCFLTGGGTFQASGQNDGSDTLTSIGEPDPPVNDVAHPTLAAVFCIGPTGAAAINNVAGLPGPGRVTLRGTALGLP